MTEAVLVAQFLTFFHPNFSDSLEACKAATH